MKAVIVKGATSSSELVFTEVDNPECGPGDVEIEVTASGVNRADLLQRAGQYPPPPGASTLLGLEVSGTVSRVGEGVRRWKRGDAVCALLSGGGYAERVVVSELQVMRAPSSCSLQSAAGIPEAFITAYLNLFIEAALKSGERALVHGGSSGVGTAAVQLLRLANCPVIVTVGNEQKAIRCLELGASAALNYREEDFATGVRRWSNPQGVDVILDMVGGEYLERNLGLLNLGGRLVVIATSGGAKGTLNLVTLMQKRARIIGSVLRSRSSVEKGAIIESFVDRFGAALEGGQISPVIDSVFPIERAAEAHEHMRSSAHIGKILLSWR